MLKIGGIPFDSILWFCLSGHCFYLGTVLLIIAPVLQHYTKSKLLKVGLYLIYIFALAAIILSATPLYPGFYLVWFAAFILWLVLPVKKGKQERSVEKVQTCRPVGAQTFRKEPLSGGLHPRLRTRCPFWALEFLYFYRAKQERIALTVLLGCCFAAMLLELPWHGTQTISLDQDQHVYVIGDSVSAGMGNREEQTWPELFGQLTGVSTTNLARAGATVETALKKQATGIDQKNALVILEIGGNDLLGGTSHSAFEANADALLASLSTHRVVWLELPLLPQHYQYGRIQRKLAQKYEVTLIPKAVFVQVLKAAGATSDGIHLTPSGHEVMASEMAKLFKANR